MKTFSSKRKRIRNKRREMKVKLKIPKVRGTCLFRKSLSLRDRVIGKKQELND